MHLKNLLASIVVGLVAMEPCIALADFHVYVSPPPGSYDAPVTVSLHAERPAAKIFYSFKPNGSPTDDYLYTGAVRIVRTTPFFYFATVSPTDESPILSGTYTINYPAAVHFESGIMTVTATGTIDLTIVNAEDVGYDISGWQVVGQDESRTLSTGSYVAPQGTYSVLGFKYVSGGVITLRSPDSEEHSTVSVQVVPAPPVTPKPTGYMYSAYPTHAYAPATDHTTTPSVATTVVAPAFVPDETPAR